jgi:aryl-alcohol dehydrogenase-like predicted oxidoreductase
MKYKILGSSGLRVSELCLGTMTFCAKGGTDTQPADAKVMYDEFRSAGGNFVDTANIYTGGESETQLGKLIAADRAGIVLASKYSMTTAASDPNAAGNHRKNMVQAIEGSLARLQTDYIDIYWVHGWDRMTRIDEVMRGLDDLVRAGKILHIGVSNCPAWWISQANTLASERHMTAFTALQLHYNLVERSIEADFFDLAAAQDMALTAWSPLAGGLLSGKYNTDKDAEGRLTKVSYGAGLLAEHRLKIAQGVADMAADIGCEPAALALAWLLHRPQGTVIPIIGARTLEQFAANMACLEIDLSADQIATLDELNVPAPVYPASLFKSEFFSQMIAGEQGILDR